MDDEEREHYVTIIEMLHSHLAQILQLRQDNSRLQHHNETLQMSVMSGLLRNLQAGHTELVMTLMEELLERAKANFAKEN